MAILPGMEELFSLLKVKGFAEGGSYDVIVIDCAPTGETVRMLGVPEILNFYFTRIFPIQRTVLRSVRPVAQRMTDIPIPEDDVFGALKSLYGQMEGMGPLLQDPRRSSIRLVLNPERMVVKESQRLHTYLGLFGFPVDCVIANRVLPEEARSPYFDRWFEIQSGHLRRSTGGLRAAAALRRPPLRSRNGRDRSPEGAGAPRLRRYGPDDGLLQGEAGGGQEGGQGLRPLHPPPLCRKGQDPGVGREAKTSWCRWTIRVGTCCCRGPSRPGAFWAPPSRASGCAWASARRRQEG